jgi:predicted nucleic acid-binding protein
LIVAVDASTLRRLLEKKEGSDVAAARDAFLRGEARLPPPAMTEILSQPSMPQADIDALTQIALLAILPGYWTRAGHLRAEVLRAGRKARLADTLIAQSCIDHDVPLITYDRDFRHFTAAGLRLL